MFEYDIVLHQDRGNRTGNQLGACLIPRILRGLAFLGLFCGCKLHEFYNNSRPHNHYGEEFGNVNRKNVTIEFEVKKKQTVKD